mmetsp:Transcript_2912/g.4550  ORF Transcript_2912/g.4550 Transcript_2912/m.4550 type:complete len:338 (-) Transcript_2912:23-1036(-)
MCALFQRRDSSDESIRKLKKKQSQAIEEWFSWEENNNEPEDLYEWLWAMREKSALDWSQGLSESEYRQVIKKQFHLPVQIVEPHIFLGDALCVHNIENLKKLGITSVLNAAGGSAIVPVEKLRVNGISYSQFDQAQDLPSYPMLQNHLDEARAIFAIEHARQGRVLVHCVQGLNRSAILTAAEYMLLNRTDILTTVKHLRTQRCTECLTNRGFHLQLAKLAKAHNLLGPKPGHQFSCVSKKAPTPQPKNIHSTRELRKDFVTPSFLKALLPTRLFPKAASSMNDFNSRKKHATSNPFPTSLPSSTISSKNNQDDSVKTRRRPKPTSVPGRYRRRSSF